MMVTQRKSPRKRGLAKSSTAAKQTDDSGDSSSKRNKLDHAGRKEPTLLDLYRLLHCMETDSNPADVSTIDLKMRAEMCQSMLTKLQIADSNAKLQQRAQAAIQRAAEVVAEREQSNNDPQPDLIQRVFFANNSKVKTPTTTRRVNSRLPPDQELKEEKNQKPSPSKKQTKAVSKRKPSRGAVPPPAAATATPSSVADMQQQQREQMEAAVAQMAKQMKDHTKHIHETLQTQNQDLSKMENIAAEKVDEVSDVAKSTQEHVSKSWRRTAATWTLLFTIVAAFVGTLVTIQLVPKRKGACLFFCGNNDEEKFCRILPNGKKECLAAVDHPSATGTNKKENNRRKSSEEQQAPLYNAHDEVGEPKIEPEEVTKKQQQVVEDDSADEETADTERTEGVRASVEDLSAEIDHEEEEEADTEENVDEEEELETEEPDASEEEVEEDGKDEDTDDKEVEKEVVEEEPSIEEEAEELEPSPSMVTQGSQQETAGMPTSPTFRHTDAAIAAVHGKVDQLRMFVAQKPELLNEGDSNGWTLLHEAARNGQTEVVRLLLELGCDTTVKTRSHRTAIDLALEQNGPKHQDIVALIRDSTNQQKECEIGMDGECLPNESQQHEKPQKFKEAEKEEVEDDKEKKTNEEKEEPDASEATSEEDHSEKTPPQEEKPAVPEFRYTDLIVTTIRGDVDKLRTYFAAKPEFVHKADSNGWTILHHAARNGKTDVVRLMVELGCDATSRTRKGDHTALGLAQKFGLDHPIVVLLKERMGQQLNCEVGMDGECLPQQQQEEEQQEQPEASTDTNPDSNIGADPFGSGEVVADEETATEIPAFRGKPFSGKDVRRAATKGDVGTIQGFIDNADADYLAQPDQNGWTSLHLAIRAGHYDVVELLLEAGVDVNLETTGGRTPIDIAILRFGEDSDMVRLVEEYEGDDDEEWEE